MIETIVIALIFSKYRGYNVKVILREWIIYPVVIMEVIHQIVQVNIFFENYKMIEYMGFFKILYLCSYLPIIYKYELYISSIIGSILMVMGGMLNDIAIKVNDGMMPVFPTLSFITGYATVESFDKVNDIHILGDENTRLKFLTDIFDLGYSVLSIGDIFIRGYVFLIIFNLVKKLNKSQD